MTLIDVNEFNSSSISFEWSFQVRSREENVNKTPLQKVYIF